MAKLRHIAITVSDVEKAAAFYQRVFGMTRYRGSRRSIHLTDGVMDLAILSFETDEQAGDERGKDFVGLHHFGFVVDDVEDAARRIEAAGGRYHMRVASRHADGSEVKYRDPDGIVFDIVVDTYATKAWGANTKV